MSHKLPPNSVGWHILEGYPWWPVFVCDAFKLRTNLHQLGSGHRQVQRKAREYPNDYALVYFFGTHNFGQVRLNKGKVLVPWDCDEKHLFLKGVPGHLVKKKAQLDELKFAIEEAEDFLSMPEDIRLPPFMVPSDLDPSIEPPPAIERDEAMDDDGDEDEDGDEDGGSDREDAGDQDADGSGASDGEGKKSSRKNSAPKEKKAAKKKKPSSAKEKKVSSSSSSKEKGSSKEKKASSSSSKVKKESSKEKKSARKDGGAEDKKRKKPSASDEAAAATKASPSKVAKKEKAVDVKSEAAEKHAKTSKSKAEKKAADATADHLSGEELSAVLEKEIKWILANCQFEEMTTKTVRKLLEKRLKMDLRNHKTSIKESVARVIAAMEDGMDAGAGDDETPPVKEEAVPEKKESSPAPAAASADGPDEVVAAAAAAAAADSEPSNSSAAKEEEQTDEPEPVAETSEDQDVKMESESTVAQHLADAARELAQASNDDSKVVSALSALQQQVPSVEREVVSSSPLLPKLVSLRAHEEKSVSSLVASLAKQWGVEDLVPAPQPIREEDILAMKEKLESAETSHDDMLTCLSQLSMMRLGISHMKNTGIARVVANLRQHANDKVSIAAANLRKSWIQSTKSKTESKSDADRVKSLVAMNRMLEQKDSEEGENSHLAVLEKLQSTTLSTQDIIDSKIGVVVSKLRKSSNEKVAKAATQLRKKWKTEAAA